MLNDQTQENGAFAVEIWFL